MIRNISGRLGLVFLFAMFAVASCPVGAQDFEKSTIVGVWHATAETDNGEQTSVWTIQRSGEGYAGKYVSSESDQQRELSDIRFDGKVLTFQFDVEVEDREYVIKVVSELNDKSIDGNWAVEKKKNGKELASGKLSAVRNASPEWVGQWKTTAALPDGAVLRGTMSLKGNHKVLSGTLVVDENETRIDKIAVQDQSVRMEFKLDVEGDLRDIVIEAKMKFGKSLDGKWILLDRDGNEEESGNWGAERIENESSASSAKTDTDVVFDGSRPNILLLITDQHAATALSCVGNRNLKTPALDQLAAEGVRFERAYVTQPLCLPCRSSLQTGRYPHEIGTISNGRSIQGEFPLLGNLVNDAGYESAYIGKWHVGTSLQQAGYAEAIEAKRDRDKSQIAREFLLRDHDKPFFLTVSFLNPHNVCQLARGQELPDGPIGKPPGLLNELPGLPDNFDVPENEPTAIRQVQASSPSHYPTTDWDELKWRQYLWGYYRLVEQVDTEIATVIEALDKSGQRDNTVIIFVSDHGEGVAMHHWNQKQILYEESVRVPFFVSWRGKTKPRVTDMLASVSLDIPATILSFTGAKKPESMRGMSLKEFALGGPVARERNFVVAETMFAKGDRSLGLVGRMVRTDKYKYCVYDVGQQREQLFDMDADPGEKNNLVVDANFSDEVDRHRALIAEWARQTSDSDFPYVKAKSVSSDRNGVHSR